MPLGPDVAGFDPAAAGAAAVLPAVVVWADSDEIQTLPGMFGTKSLRNRVHETSPVSADWTRRRLVSRSPFSRCNES